MAILFIAIPKEPSDAARNQAEQLCTLVADAAQKFVGPRYGRPPQVVQEATVSHASALFWAASEEADVFAIQRGRWAMASSANVAPSLRDSLQSNAGQYRYTDPVWGSYMAVLGDKNTDRLFAWNTVPTLEAVHYGQNDEYIFISNRPILIAIGIAAGKVEHIALNNEYLREYLNIGYSVSGVTPFVGVKVLPPRRSLSIVGRHLSLTDAPSAPKLELEPQGDPRYTGARELADAFHSATNRGIARRQSNDFQLRLSGGLDSRIVLGLLRDKSSISITAVTQGDATSQDVMVASELANAAQVPHIVKHPDFVDPSGFIESLERSIFESQGYIPSEALVAPYSNADPLSSPEVLVSGQWPLFKGVMDKTMSNGLDFVRDRIMRTNSNILSDDQNILTDEALELWLSTVPAATNMEILYMHGRDLRSSRYLQPHNIQADRVSQVFYPFIDSQVSAVADQLPTRNRVQNISAFLAGTEIWPDSMRIPMAYNGHFRFEANEPLAGISGAYFDDRRAPIKPYSGPVAHNAEVYNHMASYTRDPLVSSSRYLVASNRWSSIERHLNPQFREQVYNLAKLEPGTSSRLFKTRAARRMLTLHCWRVVLADLWLSRSWLQV